MQGTPEEIQAKRMRLGVTARSVLSHQSSSFQLMTTMLKLPGQAVPLLVVI
jgi:hypothetical protein